MAKAVERSTTAQIESKLDRARFNVHDIEGRLEKALPLFSNEQAAAGFKDELRNAQAEVDQLLQELREQQHKEVTTAQNATQSSGIGGLPLERESQVAKDKERQAIEKDLKKARKEVTTLSNAIESSRIGGLPPLGYESIRDAKKELLDAEVKVAQLRVKLRSYDKQPVIVKDQGDGGSNLQLDGSSSSSSSFSKFSIDTPKVEQQKGNVDRGEAEERAAAELAEVNVNLAEGPLVEPAEVNVDLGEAEPRDREAEEGAAVELAEVNADPGEGKPQHRKEGEPHGREEDELHGREEDELQDQADRELPVAQAEVGKDELQGLVDEERAVAEPVEVNQDRGAEGPLVEREPVGFLAWIGNAVYNTARQLVPSTRYVQEDGNETEVWTVGQSWEEASWGEGCG